MNIEWPFDVYQLGAATNTGVPNPAVQRPRPWVTSKLVPALDALLRSKPTHHISGGNALGL